MNQNYGFVLKIDDVVPRDTDDVISGRLYDENHPPLGIWTTDYGMHSNIDVKRDAIELLGG